MRFAPTKSAALAPEGSSALQTPSCQFFYTPGSIHYAQQIQHMPDELDAVTVPVDGKLGWLRFYEGMVLPTKSSCLLAYLVLTASPGGPPNTANCPPAWATHIKSVLPTCSLRAA